MEIQKQYENLSKYAITESGSVIELATGEELPLTEKKNYLLQTDESLYLPIAKRTILLKRRFTQKDIESMFNSPKAKPLESDSPKPKSDSKTVASDSNESGDSTKKAKSDSQFAKKVIQKVKVARKLIHDSSTDSKSDSHPFPFPYLKVNGVPYKSSREAAKVLSESNSTILRKAKAATPGYEYIEK